MSDWLYCEVKLVKVGRYINKCIILISFVFLIFLAVSVVNAEIVLSNYNPKPGETVLFNGTVNYLYCQEDVYAPSCWHEWTECWKPNMHIYIKDLAGAYIKPDYNITKDAIGKNTTVINGSFKVPGDWQSGNYTFYIDHSYSATDYTIQSCGGIQHESPANFYPGGDALNFVIGNASSSWQMSTNGRDWSAATLPAGNAQQWSGINSRWGDSATFKTSFWLDKPTAGVLKLDVENNVNCKLNDITIIQSNGNMHGTCRYTGGNYFTSYYWYNWISVVCPYISKQAGQANIIQNLKSGWNNLTCSASASSRFYDNYYSGKAYFDANLSLLEPSEIKWSTTASSDWYKLNLSDTSWYWTQLPVSDTSAFLTSPDYFNKQGYTNYGSSPYNGATTYFRAWIWSGSNITKILKISDNKLPSCYFNEQQMNLSPYNHAYWRYSTNINLKQGFNLLACSSAAASFNQFDYQLADVNGPLKITDIIVSGEQTTGSKLTFTPVIKNANHPEADVGIVMQVVNENKTQIFTNSIKSDNLSNVYSFNNAFSYIPGTAGNYIITIAAKDNIDNDTDNYSAQLAVTQAAFSQQQIGFLPVSGSSDEKVGSAENSALVAVGAAALGTAVLAGAYVYSSSGTSVSRSLKRIEDSIVNISSAVSALNAMQINSQQANTSSFTAMINEKYAAFQDWLAQLNADNEHLKEARERNEWLLEQEEKKIKQQEAELAAQQLLDAASNPTLNAYAYWQNWRDMYGKDWWKKAGFTKNPDDAWLAIIMADITLRKAYQDWLAAWVIAHKPNQNPQPTPGNIVTPTPVAPVKQISDQDLAAISQTVQFAVNGIVGIGQGISNFITSIIIWISEHPFETMGIVAAAILVILFAYFAGILALIGTLLSIEIVTIGSIIITVGNVIEAITIGGMIYTSLDTFIACGSDPNSQTCKDKGIDSGGWIVAYVAGEAIFRIGGAVFKGVTELAKAQSLKAAGFTDEEIRALMLADELRAAGIAEDQIKLTIRDKDLINNWRNTLKQLSVDAGKMSDAQVLKYVNENKVPIVPTYGSYELTEEQIALYNNKYYPEGGLTTPDKIIVNNGMIDSIVQDYAPNYGTFSTMADNVWEDIIKAIKLNQNAAKYGLESSSDLRITIKIDGTAPEDMASLMLNDINEIIAGGKPQLFPAGYAGKDMQELLDVKNLLQDEKISVEATSEVSFTPNLVTAGLSVSQAQLIISDTRFTKYSIDSSLSSEFAVKPDGELIINPSKAATLSDTAFKYGLEHEASELAKVKLQDSGKILSDIDITNKVNKLTISSTAKQEVDDLISERLIADKIVLKNRPNLLQGWKEESATLITNMDNWYYGSPKTEAQISENLPELAYLKALNPSDATLMKEVNELIKNLSEANRLEFEQILNVMMEVIKNV